MGLATSAARRATARCAMWAGDVGCSGAGFLCCAEVATGVRRVCAAQTADEEGGMRRRPGVSTLCIVLELTQTAAGAGGRPEHGEKPRRWPGRPGQTAARAPLKQARFPLTSAAATGGARARTCGRLIALVSRA